MTILVTTVVVVSLFTLVTAFVPAALADFWRDQPVLTNWLTGVSSGLALLLLAKVLVDAHFHRQDLRQWEHVAMVGYRGLAHEIWWMRRRVEALVTGSALHEHSTRVPERVAAEFQEHQAALGDLPEAFRPRLHRLLDRYEYSWHLHRQTAAMQEEAFALLATWSPVMLQSAELRTDLARMGSLVDALMELNREIWQGAALNLPREQWAASPSWKARMSERFDGVFTAVAELSERLTTQSRLPWHEGAKQPVPQVEPRHLGEARTLAGA